ncbi:aminomethyl-transferring glycine dehydrogenase subunit GcvPB [bacterium]|nr:aminomethyl-transferring glycine dehydrogenase subunit GcvPB [bacterium]
MNFISKSGLSFEEPLIFERSVAGREGYSLKDFTTHGANPEDIFGDDFVRDEITNFPEVSEPDVVRHFTRLSQWNYGVDSGFYPLGSCTMKYNPKINEEVARLDGFTSIHPYFPESIVQGALELIYNLQNLLKNITGLKGVSLQPAAGAHGELAGIKIIKKYHQSRSDSKRKYILIPDTAHGTNPASCTLAGFETKNISSGPDGYVTAESIAAIMDETVAGIMLTNPNTLGVYEQEICKIIKIVHEKGGLVYADGANMNAFLGKVRPADFGVDVMHINLHKTFSTPHGGGGPGSGPVLVSEQLIPFLPVPIVAKDDSGQFFLNYDLPSTIGRMKSFYGNFLVAVRAYTYIREMGNKGLAQATEDAVLSANYIRASLKEYFHLPYDTDSLHEVVFTNKKQSEYGVKTLDIAKRLIDYGIHPPTIYFPLIVHEAIMIEPTETESKADLDNFINVMIAISEEAKNSPELLHEAPKISFRRRMDEVKAAKNPKLRWYPEETKK